MKVLKTTQSGYTGFLHDEYTVLPDTTDRIAATSVTATWKYSSRPPCFNTAYATAKTAMCEAFFGPARGGVYSPAVQTTLYDMGKAVVQRVPQVR